MCAKFKLRLGDNKFVKIPISLAINTIDQAEVVNRDFVSVEVDKAINPIIDYEKTRFTPILQKEKVEGEAPIIIPIKDLTINVNLLDENGNSLTNTTYADAGFEDDDIKYNKNRFLNTFIRLNFYDYSATTNQNLVSQITIFSKVTEHEINPLTDGGIPVVGGGLPIPANQFPIRYILSNPIITPKGFAEGFYIYHYKNDVFPKELFMRAEFNNAATGISTNLMASNRSDLSINELVGKLHTRYLLTRDNTGYYYAIDKDYNIGSGEVTNVTENSSKDVTLNLYQIKVI
jgi:hypothetical protein